MVVVVEEVPDLRVVDEVDVDVGALKVVDEEVTGTDKVVDVEVEAIVEVVEVVV